MCCISYSKCPPRVTLAVAVLGDTTVPHLCTYMGVCVSVYGFTFEALTVMNTIRLKVIIAHMLMYCLLCFG